MSLARSVLALHDGIREVFILEAKPGQYTVVDTAIGPKGASVLSESILGSRKHAQMVPAVLLGGAAQFTGDPESLRHVGILYRNAGVILVNLSEEKLLAISTSPEALYEAMMEVEKGLPRLVELEAGEISERVRSAAEAENIARSYVAGQGNNSSILIDEVSYHRIEHQWKIHGSYRPSKLSFSKSLELELDANSGNVTRYSLSAKGRRYGIFLLFVEVACFLAIVLAIILLQRIFFR